MLLKNPLKSMNESVIITTLHTYTSALAPLFISNNNKNNVEITETTGHVSKVQSRSCSNGWLNIIHEHSFTIMYHQFV